MPSMITWVDHDAAARERSLRILSLFQEKESRDELGLGGVRDAFADRLFPGTSTIQTRLRYMLFVPWIYTRMEEKRVPAAQFGAAARELELALVEPLLASADTAGVFGKTAGGRLKRLPSSVYWAGLGAWGIRRFEGAQEDYHRAVDALYVRRDARDRRRGPEGDDAQDATLSTWHLRLPSPPKGFPQKVDFVLSREEAEFLLDRLVNTQKDSLLSHLALGSSPAEVDFPWEHPDRAGFTPLHRELLDNARRFSEIMHGAALLYNLLLAEIAKRQELAEEHRNNLTAWAEGLDLAALRSWSLLRLWELTTDQSHIIKERTRAFVGAWVDIATSKPTALADDAFARTLIEHRERSLKGGQSRFANERARDQWGGYAGTARLSYRWPTAKSFLRDLHAGLEGG
jgi:hypothetical protein